MSRCAITFASLSLILLPAVAVAQMPPPQVAPPAPPTVQPPPDPPPPPTPPEHMHDHDDDGDHDDDDDGDHHGMNHGMNHGGGGGGGHGHKDSRDPGERAAMRPDGYSIGVGFGYTFPADLQAPNTTSVRFRLKSGFTLEPVAVLAANGSSSSPGDSSSSAFELTVGGLGRWPVASHGRVDLVLLGGAAFTFNTNNPDGDDNDTTQFGVTMSWGLAVEYWFGRQFTMSLNALNPVATLTKTTTEQAFGDDQSTTNWAVGAVFDPTVMMMLHLFW